MAALLAGLSAFVGAQGFEAVRLAPPADLLALVLRTLVGQTGRNYLLELRGHDLMRPWPAALREYITTVLNDR